MTGYFIAVNLFFSVLITLICIELRKIINFVGIILFCIFTARKWLIFGSTQFMSEQFGLLFQILAILAFLHGINRRKTVLKIFAVHLFIIGELIRPGDIFLPIVIGLVICLEIYFREKHSIYRLFFHVFAFFATYTTLNLIAAASHLKQFMNSGNTWATIYGLTHGNADWTLAQNHFAGQYSTEGQLWSLARKASISQFLADPMKTFQAIFSNFIKIFLSLFQSMLGLSFKPMVSALLCFSFVLFFLKKLFETRKDSKYQILSLFGGIWIFESISYGIVYKSDPFRTMSSSVLIDALFVLFVFFRKKEFHFREKYFAGEHTGQLLEKRNEAVVLVFPLFLAILFLITPFQSQPLVQIPSDLKCLSEGGNVLLNDGVLVKSGFEIQTEGLISWWPALVRSHKMGFFIEGFSKGLGGSLNSVNLYSSEDPRSSRGVVKFPCYQLKDRKDSELQALGFQEITFINDLAVPSKTPPPIVR